MKCFAVQQWCATLRSWNENEYVPALPLNFPYNVRTKNHFSMKKIKGQSGNQLCTFIMKRIPLRYRPRFFNQVGHQTTYASIGNKHFFTCIMSLSDLQKLWTELTKIGHIFRKQSTPTLWLTLLLVLGKSRVKQNSC